MPFTPEELRRLRTPPVVGKWIETIDLQLEHCANIGVWDGKQKIILRLKEKIDYLILQEIQTAYANYNWIVSLESKTSYDMHGEEYTSYNLVFKPKG